MNALWDYFITNWLVIFWSIIGFAFMIIGFIALMDRTKEWLDGRMYRRR